jgi:hypothetical protein
VSLSATGALVSGALIIKSTSSAMSLYNTSSLASNECSKKEAALHVDDVVTSRATVCQRDVQSKETLREASCCEALC